MHSIKVVFELGDPRARLITRRYPLRATGRYDIAWSFPVPDNIFWLRQLRFPRLPRSR